MPSEVMTMCFHTRDAVEVDGASYTFEMPLGRLREDAMKVALASCEFPMVQWTVEEEWCRLWLNEGVRLSARNNYLDVRLSLRVTSDKLGTYRLRLPPRLNAIKKVCRSGARHRVECHEEHGLASVTGGLVVVLVGGAGGDLRVASSEIVIEDARTVSIAYEGDASKVAGATHVYVPTVASHPQLCTMLTAAANATLPNGFKMAFRYDRRDDTVRATCTVPRLDAQLHVLSTPLATLCGLSTVPMRFAEHTQVLPCESTSLWDYVELPTGFYSPSHRPMCVGPPHRLGPEMEAAVNRFYFPIGGGSTANGADGAHILVFGDPDGHILTCNVPNGRYSAASLARHLQTAMTETARAFDAGVSFVVSVDPTHRFVLSCERRHEDGRVLPCTFALLFHHPLCIDAARLGFPPQPLSGQTTYVSSAPVKPLMTEPTGGRTVANVFRVSEIGAQKRLRFHGVPPPPMVAVVAGRAASRLRVHTFVNRQPFAHGYQAGDLVRLTSYPAHAIADADGKEVKVSATRASLPVECSCVVVDADSDDPCALTLEVPPIDGLGEAGTCVQLTSDPEPWNMHFRKPRSLPPHVVGIDAAAIWGVDGSVLTRERLCLPPYEAPNTHCLDHPDYVLLTFSESAGAAFEHAHDGQNKAIFCKLSLYPLFREERMLPRDTSLLSGNFSRFTLSFWNPDLAQPYKFHGAHFSFSLNFVSHVPG